MGRGPGWSMKTRGPSHGSGGRCHRRSISRRPGWTTKTRGPPDRLGKAAPMSPHLMGRGRARPIKFRVNGPRPRPTHQVLISWAAARPGPSIFQTMGRGPARPGPSYFQKMGRCPARTVRFSKLSARPGPARHIRNSRPGP